METVRVRIAVGVDSAGHWAVQGWGPLEAQYEKFAAEAAVQLVGTLFPAAATPHRALYWIEADVPIPAAQTIEAETVPA